MAHGNRWEARLRRLAAGIDVNAQGITVVVLARSWRARQPVRVAGLAWQALAPGVVHGAELLDRAAVMDALRDAFELLPRACKRAASRCAMALPAALTQVSSLPLEQLALDVRPDDDDELLVGLEPLALAEAERVTGQERGELAVDWCVEPGPSLAGNGEPARYLTITAAAHEHLEARLECTTAAGLTLCVMDGEAHAALRAMRYMAALTTFIRAPEKRCAALWVGQDGLYGWIFTREAVMRETRYPCAQYATLTQALHALRREDTLDCALISGELRLLENWQASTGEMGDALACAILPFECATLATGAARTLSPLMPPNLLHASTCAVAFGLALRGVNE
jgi:Tfp pilus assembly PilM family ATPase